jgi:ABC-type Fe3+ transport system substrate-binding protein
MKITENMTVKQVLEFLPESIGLFKSGGIGKFEDPEVLSSLGSILKLKSALSMAGIDKDAFIAELNKQAEEGAQEKSFSEDYSSQRSLSMLSLLPCGMKMPFMRRFEEFKASMDDSENINCLIEGNVNHEISYYPYIDRLEDAEELPDLIVSADINSFLHHSFVEKFINTGCFKAIEMDSGNPDFADTDYTDPDKSYTMLSANILVLVANKRVADDYPKPESWSELLRDVYAKSITMRGQEEFFCSGVLMPFYKDHGLDGIAKMARNVKKGLHPAEMVKEIERGSKDETPFYIMPLFFANRLKDESLFEIIYPDSGAIISPVFMLAKKGHSEAAGKMIDFITGRDLNEFCARAGFPSVRSDIDNGLPEGCKLSWMGWDFLKREDPMIVKDNIQDVFSANFKL